MDPKNQNDVIRLQRALSRLLRRPFPMHIGIVDPLTQKALRRYQAEQGLPITADLDDTTLEHIEQQLKVRGLTIP